MPLIRSWLASANSPDTDFPLNNLPLGVFSNPAGPARCGVAVGDMILDCAALERAGLLRLGPTRLMDRADWVPFLEAGPRIWARLRILLLGLLSEGSALRAQVEAHLHPQAGATLHLPFRVAEFTDFYASLDHARNVGTMFRGPDNALPPNWLHMPIGYNGRASSVVVSGTDIRRPWGQIKPPEAEAPVFAPSRRFDFELELGAVVGQPTRWGRPVSVAEADAAIFGFVLLNDWSARDIQAWEYQPLGPFQSKATATTISPWIVPKAALEPFRCGGPVRTRPLLPYLDEPGPMHFDIALEAELTPEGGQPTVICRTNARQLYYSAAQQLAHHTTSGCPMRVGDLLGSGTISGPERDSRGCLLELSWGGKEPVPLTGGGHRTFLEDGDRLTIRGHAQGDGYRIGFGEATGVLRPALARPYG
jgi:fumarylacetoacetase